VTQTAPAPSVAARRGGASAAQSAPARDGRTRRAAWLLGAAGLVLVFTVRPFGADPDVWWHLAVGRLITAHGIPSQEPFTFLGAPNAWIGQQWGYEVALARLVDAGGPALAMVVMGLVGSTAFVVAALSTRRRDRVPAWAKAAAIAVSALVAGELLGVRGQVVTVLGAAVTLLIVVRWRDGSRRAPWALVPLLAVWANLHAGFLVGLALPLIAALTVSVWQLAAPVSAPKARTGRLVLATAAAAAAVLANPAGPHLYGYVAQTFVNPTLTGSITEWQSPNFHLTGLRLFEIEAVGLVVLWVLSRRPDPLDVVLALAAVAASLQAQRNVALFAVVATPQLATYGARSWERWRTARPLSVRRPRAPSWFAPALAAVVILASVGIDVLPNARPAATRDYEARHEPKAAADYVSTHLRGQRLYSTYEWGGYLAYRFPDDRAVYVYGESAVLGPARLDEYLQVHYLEAGWQDVLHSRQMRVAVVPAGSQETAAFLEVGWMPLCYDRESGATVLIAPTAPQIGPPAADPPDASGGSACTT